MRLMSFSMTTPQVERRQKTETRRLGWAKAKPGDRVVAVEKAMGLGQGGHPRPLAVIEFLEVRREPLYAIGTDAVEREGYPGHTSRWFVDKFCDAMKCQPGAIVTAIRFRYLDINELTKPERQQWDRLTARAA